MIYLDNSATTLQKPPEVAKAVAYGIDHFGNPGRSFYDGAMLALRQVFTARAELAQLVGLEDPLGVAFTSGATESLNLVMDSLISPDDGVITTVLEHNSVLRPLYKIGCPLSFINCDDTGRLQLENLSALLQKNTKFLVATHGSNLLGSVSDLGVIYKFCQENNLTFILDAAQTMGSIRTPADSADIMVFTGHKALFGPQGTGGIITRHKNLPFRLVKTGGTGSNSFAQSQPLQMPDVFEAGTANAHGLAGLQKGVAYLNQTGITAVQSKEEVLSARFLEGIADLPGCTLYGAKVPQGRLPVFALNLGDFPSEDLALRLWEGWQIATRAGSHCAPLVHKRFGTEDRGMVRFSFSYFTTLEEIDTTIGALRILAKEG